MPIIIINSWVTYLIQRQKMFVNESSIFNLIKNSDLNEKLATLATKAELKAEQNKTRKLQTQD